jgi:hypothetical protein
LKLDIELHVILSLPFCHFQLKELEKLGPKKGVISQSVKDVVQSLVDDDLVLKDKIGTSVSSYHGSRVVGLPTQWSDHLHTGFAIKLIAVLFKEGFFIVQ